MTDQELAKEFMSFEMKEPLSDYGDPLDLAADCCSTLELWENDYSIPQWVADMAGTFFP